MDSKSARGRWFRRLGRFAAAGLLAACSGGPGTGTAPSHLDNPAGTAPDGTRYIEDVQITCPGDDVDVPFVSLDGSAYLRLHVDANEDGSPTRLAVIAEISYPTLHTTSDPSRPDKLYVGVEHVDEQGSRGDAVDGAPIDGAPMTPYFGTSLATLEPGDYALNVLQPWFWDDPTPTRLHVSCSGNIALSSDSDDAP